MIGLVGILAFLTVLALSMVITRIANIALASTGLSHEAAKFQARSAFTGTGFTTKEAEKIVDHPVRRRIIHLLMLLRSAGIVSILISLILSFAGSRTEADYFLRLSLLVAGLLILLGLVNTKAVNRYLTRRIEAVLQRWSDMDTRDYASLLKLSGDYRVLELQIQKNDWIEGKTLEECKLDREGVRVLGIYRQLQEFAFSTPTSGHRASPRVRRGCSHRSPSKGENQSSIYFKREPVNSPRPVIVL